MSKHEQQFRQQVGQKAARKQRARHTRHNSIWAGLGLFGLVGWSVAVPMLLGLALGLWLDRQWPGRFSWTLLLLLLGVLLGCLHAWRWLERERRQMVRRHAKEPRDE